MTSLVNITIHADVREKGLFVCRGTHSSAPKSSKQPPKTREPEQLRSWLVICGFDNVQDYDVADFSAIQSGFRSAVERRDVECNIHMKSLFNYAK